MTGSKQKTQGSLQKKGTPSGRGALHSEITHFLRQIPLFPVSSASVLVISPSDPLPYLDHAISIQNVISQIYPSHKTEIHDYRHRSVSASTIIISQNQNLAKSLSSLKYYSIILVLMFEFLVSDIRLCYEKTRLCGQLPSN